MHGIEDLAKNERDVGHSGRGEEDLSETFQESRALVLSIRVAGEGTVKLKFDAALVLAIIVLLGTTAAGAQEQIQIDASAPTTPFPHFWEQMFGSGRAILTLRDSYRDDLRAVKQVTDFKYVRFHAILHDEVGVYNEDEHGNPVYNFSYVDQIYDGLLKNGVRPVVEISFMPKKLAFNPDALHPFWYKPNVSPPKSLEAWDALMTHFAQHLIERYGIDEVAQWYFEVWNEPNIDFWDGIPRKGSYFELYAHTARALKAVNPRLRVGGPATAAAAWVDAFLKYDAANHVPIDFVSSHGYADDTVQNLFHSDENIPMDDRVCRAIAKVSGQINASSMPNLPLVLDRVERAGHERVAGHHLCRSGSREHSAGMRWQGDLDVLLDLLRRIRRGRPNTKTVRG